MLLSVLVALTGMVRVAAGQGDTAGGGPTTYALARKANYVPLETLRRTGSRVPAPLARRVSLQRDSVLLQQVLLDVANQAELGLSYGEDLVRAHVRVSVHVRGATAADVLQQAVEGTEWAVLVTPAGQVAVLRAEPPQVGAIAGRVTAREGNGPLAGATVVALGTSKSATTGEDGRYRIAEVPAGTYTVRARYIGYAPGAASVTVSAEQEATVDFALEKSAQPLDEVVTTGTVVPTEVKALPTPMSVITAADIEDRQPRSVTDIVRQTVPGAVAWDLSAVSPSQTVMSVRGTSALDPGSGQLKVYLDGIELASESFAAIDPSSIERVEIIRGPQAATLYGADAIGGVMQVFTKRGDSTRTRPEVSASAAFGLIQSPYAGSSGAVRQDYKASVSGGRNAASYYLGVGYTHNGSWYPEGTSSLPSGYGTLHVGQGPLAVDLTARYYVQNSPSSIYDPRLAQTGFPYFTKPYYQINQAQSLTYGARLSYSAASWWHHTLTLGADQLSEDIHGTQPRLTTPADTTVFVSQNSVSKASVDYNTTAAFHLSGALAGDLTAGADYYRRSGLSFFDFPAVAAGFLPGATASRTVVTTSGYFAQLQLRAWDKVFVTGGLRADHSSTLGSDVGHPVSPRVGLALAQQIGATTLKVRGSYGQAVRLPTSDESNALASGGTLQLANPDLTEERQRGWDAGLDLLIGAHAVLSATYYHQTASDLIQPVILSAGIPNLLQYQNVGRVRNTGVELEGSVKLGPAQLRAQYGYTRSRVEDLGPSYTGDLQVGDTPLLVPEHTFGATLTATPLRGTSLTAGVTYVGSWTYYDLYAEFACFGGTGPCQATQRDYWTRYPGFAKVNLQIARQLTSAVSAFVAVDNLTNNQSYEFENSLPTIGRVTVVGFRASR